MQKTLVHAPDGFACGAEPPLPKLRIIGSGRSQALRAPPESRRLKFRGANCDIQQHSPSRGLLRRFFFFPYASRGPESSTRHTLWAAQGLCRVAVHIPRQLTLTTRLRPHTHLNLSCSTFHHQTMTASRPCQRPQLLAAAHLVPDRQS